VLAEKAHKLRRVCVADRTTPPPLGQLVKLKASSYVTGEGNNMELALLVIVLFIIGALMPARHDIVLRR
jgi:hypothetical protein